MRSPKVAVIGAGVSGLSCAWKLHALGADVRVLESKDRIGGVIKTVMDSGFLCESGPNEIQIKSAEVESLLREIGLEDDILNANPASDNRYIIKKSKLTAIPMGPLGFLKTPLFSGAAKWSLFTEAFRTQAFASQGVSIADFFRAHLHQDFVDYAVGPLVSGVYGGNAETLSIRHAFPRFWDLSSLSGSLFRGALKSAKLKRKQGIKRYKYRLITFREGMKMLPEALAQGLEESIMTGAQIEQIKHEKDWSLSWRIGSDRFEDTFDALVVTVPAYSIPQLPFGGLLKSDLGILRKIQYAPISTLVTGFPSDAVDHALDGFGMLAALPENRKILGTIFSSTLFPGRAPEGQVNLMTFIGGTRHPQLAALSEEELREIVLGELRELLGVKGEPTFVKHTYWPRAIPQYGLGYQKYLDLFTEKEAEHPGLYFTGNYRHGVGVGDCLLNGANMGKRIFERA